VKVDIKKNRIRAFILFLAHVTMVVYSYTKIMNDHKSMGFGSIWEYFLSIEFIISTALLFGIIVVKKLEINHFILFLFIVHMAIQVYKFWT